MLKIGSVRWRGKCSRHPMFDPYVDGRGAIRGGCPRCSALADIHECHQRMLAMMKVFAPVQPAIRKRPGGPDTQPGLFGDLQ